MSPKLEEMRRKLLKGTLERLTPEQIMEVFPPETLLKAMSTEQIEKYMQKAKVAKTTEAKTRKPQH